MRRAAKVDRNQSEIVADLRAVGASVQPIHMIGDGAPDLLVGFGGANYVFEVKNGELPPSARELTPAEAEWHAAWRGQVTTIVSIDDALREMGLAPHNGDVAGDFWSGLDRTGRRAPCPACGAPGLEVRTCVSRGKRWFYVSHCRSVQPLGVPGAA